MSVNESRLIKIIRRPIMSEKSYKLADKYKQYVFEVMIDANKLEISKAVALMFEVKVDSVRTLRMNGKNKKYKQRPGRRRNWKKAFVKLAAGEEINFAGMAGS